MSDNMLLIAAGIGVVVILVVFFAVRGSGGDMIERQKRETAGLLDVAPRPDLSGDVRPKGPRTGVEAMLAVPHIRAAIESGRKIEAIKLVREATGMGLKEAKQLVEMVIRTGQK